MGRDKENSGFNIESTNSNHGKKIMPIDRNEYGVNLKADPVILNPRKRKIDADAILEESVGKKTRLDDILENMKNISNVLKRSLEPNNTGSLSTFTQSPSYIEGEMRSYQIAGLNWMIALYENDLSGILADEMGLGKTLQTISLIGYLQQVLKVDGRFLIVVPYTTIITHWENEFQQWCPSLRVVSLYGAKNVRQQTINVILNVKPFVWDVCLTTYEACKSKYSQNFVNSIHWHHIILDEGTRIENRSISLPQMFRRLKGSYRLILTGAPLTNNLNELWALLSFLMPKHQFDICFEDHACLGNEEAVLRNLHTILNTILLRRLKSEVENLIPYREMDVYVNITDFQREWYRKILMKNLETVRGNGEVKLRSLTAMFMQLQKCTNHPYLFEGAEEGPPFVSGDHIVNNSGKMIVLDMLLAKLKQQNSRVLVFSQFTQLLDVIEDYLHLHPEYEYCRIDGNVDIYERTNLIAQFQNPQSNKFIFLLSTRSGGLGINLTSADSVIIFDSDWNPQMDLQAIARTHRIGQTKEVRVFRLIAKDTVDEKMMELRQSDVLIESDVKSRSVVPHRFLLDAVRFGSDIILSNDLSYDGAERDKLIKENSQKLVDQMFGK